MEVAHREREDGGGEAGWQQQGTAAGGGDDGCRVPGELLRAVARIAPDDDGEVVAHLVPQEGGEPGGRADHHGAVHPVRPGAQRAAESGGAELQEAGEAVRELGGGVGVVGGGQEDLQLPARGGIRVVGDPGLDGGAVEHVSPPGFGG